MDENEHPKGALLFMLVYLLLLAALWTHAYLKLWTVGQGRPSLQAGRRLK